jgi:hypothetical protein
MSDFTDFLIWVKGGQVLEFRHKAKSVHEFCLIPDEILFDIHGSQSIRSSEIRMVRLDPRPYFLEFHKTFGYLPLGYPKELWKFINDFSEEERVRIKENYYR